MSAKQKSFSLRTLWVIGLFVILLLWAGSYSYFAFFRNDLSWGEKGSLGDSFGAVNALFAGLAFLAVVITIYQQSKALQQSKADLELQNFENKFFQLLRVHNDILQGIEKPQAIGGNSVLVRGRQRFVGLYAEFIQRYNAEKQRFPDMEDKELVGRVYETFFNANQHELGHYFRHLYSIIAFVDRSPFSHDVKMSYVKLLRAQLSSHELLLLFYNCLWERGGRKLKPLLEKYSMLEHMPTLTYKHHKSFYASGAFEEPERAKSIVSRLKP